MPFASSEEAREAARKSAEVRRAKREAQLAREAAQASLEASSVDRGDAQDGTALSGVRSSAADDRVALVRVPIPVGSIMRKLSHEAQQGDTAAARELRAWLSQFPPDDAAADASDLSGVTRAAIASILARAIAEHEEHLQTDGFQEGTQDGFDSDLDVRAPAGDGHPRDDGSHRVERGSRPPVAVHTPPTLAERVAPHFIAELNGSHATDGTDAPHQMNVDECIEVAEKEEA